MSLVYVINSTNCFDFKDSGRQVSVLWQFAMDTEPSAYFGGLGSAQAPSGTLFSVQRPSGIGLTHYLSVEAVPTRTYQEVNFIGIVAHFTEAQQTQGTRL